MQRSSYRELATRILRSSKRRSRLRSRFVAAVALLLASIAPVLWVRARADVPFLRGDINQDGNVSISDIQFFFCFTLLCEAQCMDAADVDDDGQIRLTDMVRLLNFIFLGNGTIPAPFPDVGIDPSGDNWGCAWYEARAPQTTDDRMELGHVSGRPGDRVSVTLSLASAETVNALQVVVRYDPKTFQPISPRGELESSPFFQGTVFDPDHGSARFDGGYLSLLTFPEEGILRIGLLPSIAQLFGIPPSNELAPILNILGTIPEDAEVDTVTELAFTVQSAQPQVVGTEVVAESVLDRTRVPGTLRAGSITVKGPPRFVRGDSNLDGTLEIADAIRILSFLFVGGAEPRCGDADDADDDGARSMTDAIVILGFLFVGSRPPPAPWPDCGADPTEDALDCGDSPRC
jgi:hypothetical protein